MTTPRWTDEMLDRLSETVQHTSENVDRLSGSIDRLSEASLKNEQQINSVARTFEAIATQMTSDREERNLVLQAISRQQDQHDRHQSEIQGLRIETRRMLNYLLNEQEPDDDEENSSV
jgi:methyl-accepting chemotaxis protein